MHTPCFTDAFERCSVLEKKKLLLFISLLLLFTFRDLKFMIQTLMFSFFSFQCDKIRQERDEAVKKLEEFQKSM
jgi:flagellar biosynthesis protein FliR